jgi:hypothetical protein
MTTRHGPECQLPFSIYRINHGPFHGGEVMAAKVGGFMGKVLAVVFTSIVAPVVVDLAVRDIHGEGDSPARSSSFQEEMPRPNMPAAPPITSSTPQSGEIACVIAQGVGRTPEEAHQDALRAALRRAIATQVDPNTGTRGGQTLFESVWRDRGGLIQSWKELKSKKEWHLGRSLYHEEVAVRLNYRVLGDRLRAAQPLNDTCRAN